jgi:hypothetical protein
LRERFKAIIGHYIVYTFFLAVFVFGLLNTTWVSLVTLKEERECDFLKDFGLSTLFDYFVYEVMILTMKSIIYTLLIRNDEVTWWKRCLIAFLATLPWAFAIGG